MGKIGEKVSKWGKEQREYYTRKIQESVEEEASLVKVAAALEDAGVEEERATVWSAQMVVESKDVEEARRTVSALMSRLNTEKFDKVLSQASGKEAEYYFLAQFEEVSIRVSPSDPIEGCEPVREEHTYRTWACRREEV